MRQLGIATIALVATLGLAATGVHAATANSDVGANAPTANLPAANAQATNNGQNEDATAARQLVSDAQKTVTELKSDQKFANYMEQAKGIFILPTVVKGSLIVGGQGGQGVFLVHKNGHWSNPAFFSLGAISIGAQAGGAAGPMAFLLMTDKAVNDFLDNNNFSFNANAGFTIVTYSARGQASVGKGDIILWSNMSGLQGSLNVSATDIVRNSGEDQAFYGRKATTKQIVAGQVSNPDADKLRSELPA